MRNKVRSTEEHLIRLAVQADQGYTPFKLNDQNVEDDVTITQEDLNTWKIKIPHGKSPNSTRKSQVDKEFPILWLSTSYLS
jgi:hypothetical protein